MKPKLAYRSPHQSRGKVIDLAPYLASMASGENVAGTEALWNMLLVKALESWSWRDPDSLEDLQVIIAELRALVLKDWQQTDDATG